MKNLTSMIVLGLLVLLTVPALASEPDYSDWTFILDNYYDPSKGMDYGGLKESESPRLRKLRALMSTIEPAELSRDQELAFWINFYNISVVGIVVDHYPVDSIRDISTDPIVRLNVFKKDRVPFQGREISLDWIEHETIRPKFEDPRIHFAINCAAEDCPPIRTEPYVGARVDEQLDDQTYRFLNGSNGVRLTRSGDTINVYVTKIMDWFGEDFEKWAGGRIPFLIEHLSSAKSKIVQEAEKIDLRYQDYSWDLNDWKR
ncbi:MAG: DUF547 domain-containing protein [Thermoanaerobaculia bacterium]|nr:DUF547 domain-containing protein [Thermoanaerobaculia bacterium]